MIIETKLDNWNDTISQCRRNKYGANLHKKKEMREIENQIKHQPKIEKYPIRIICYWHIKNNNSDLDNKSLKSVLDAMQEIGILENDNIKHITEIQYIAVKDTRDFLEIKIEGVDENASQS